MLSTAQEGVVFFNDGKYYTIKLITGGEVKIDTLNQPRLKLGERCLISFNNKTGEPAHVWNIDCELIMDEYPEPPTLTIDYPDFEDSTTFLDEGSVLGDSGGEDYGDGSTGVFSETGN